MSVKYQPVKCIIPSESPDDPGPLKVVAVGDSRVGITSMLVTYLLKRFPAEAKSTTIDEFTVKFTIDENEYDVCFWNVSSQVGFDNLRIGTYHNANCILVCFSVSDRPSFYSVYKRWWPEIEEHCQNAPVLLIGTKTDLRLSHINSVTLEEANEMKERIGAIEYVECSALADENLESIFDEAVRVSRTKQKSNNCTLL